VTRPRTAADLILSLFLATGLAVWCGLGLLVVLGYQNGSSASTWTGRAMMLTMAVVVTSAFLAAARASFRRAVARPLPVLGVNGWMARQPGWRLALVYWIPNAAIMLGVPYAIADHFHHIWPPWFFAPLTLGSTGVVGTGLAAYMCVIRERQRTRSAA